jgi:hypothetical protein
LIASPLIFLDSTQASIKIEIEMHINFFFILNKF